LVSNEAGDLVAEGAVALELAAMCLAWRSPVKESATSAHRQKGRVRRTMERQTAANLEDMKHLLGDIHPQGEPCTNGRRLLQIKSSCPVSALMTFGLVGTIAIELTAILVLTQNLARCAELFTAPRAIASYVNARIDFTRGSECG